MNLAGERRIKHELQRLNMKHRIALWALAGFIVATCWALYAIPVMTWADPLMVFAEITCPVILFRSYPIHLFWALALNATTYAMVGFLVEVVRSRLRHAS
jgi:hypothetical protein